jgi:hypothetical protein
MAFVTSCKVIRVQPTMTRRARGCPGRQRTHRSGCRGRCPAIPASTGSASSPRYSSISMCSWQTRDTGRYLQWTLCSSCEAASWPRTCATLMLVRGSGAAGRRVLGARGPVGAGGMICPSGTQVSAENARSSSRRDGLAVSQSTKPMRPRRPIRRSTAMHPGERSEVPAATAGR